MVNGPASDVLRWEAINWRGHEDNVRRLRQRIFTATRDGDLATVRNLQKLMLRSWSNTLISVRQATQRNAGRKTAGVDGELALSPEARAELAVRVHREARSWQPRPVKRVYIPKAGNPCKAAATRNPSDHGPMPPRPGPCRARARVGSPVRTPFLRVPSGPWLP
jgi:RNA-directed DNA polymerase